MASLFIGHAAQKSKLHNLQYDEGGNHMAETETDTQAYIFTWLLLQAYLSMTHTVCKHVKAIHTFMYRLFEHVLSKLGRVEKTERLIIYLNKLN